MSAHQQGAARRCCVHEDSIVCASRVVHRKGCLKSRLQGSGGRCCCEECPASPAASPPPAGASSAFLPCSAAYPFLPFFYRCCCRSFPHQPPLPAPFSTHSEWHPRFSCFCAPLEPRCLELRRSGWQSVDDIPTISFW